MKGLPEVIGYTPAEQERRAAAGLPYATGLDALCPGCRKYICVCGDQEVAA